MRKEPADSFLLAEPVTNTGWPCVKSSKAQTGWRFRCVFVGQTGWIARLALLIIISSI